MKALLLILTISVVPFAVFKFAGFLSNIGLPNDINFTLNFFIICCVSWSVGAIVTRNRLW